MVKWKTKRRRSGWRGQAMVEYALILTLLAIAAGITLAMTGPAIGNVFCNVVANVGGETFDPVPEGGGTCGDPAPILSTDGGPASFWETVTWVAEHPQKETPFNANP